MNQVDDNSNPRPGPPTRTNLRSRQGADHRRAAAMVHSGDLADRVGMRQDRSQRRLYAMLRLRRLLSIYVGPSRPIAPPARPLPLLGQSVLSTRPNNAVVCADHGGENRSGLRSKAKGDPETDRGPAMMATQSRTICWGRVSTSFRCPICDHPDWCSVSNDGHLVICMRSPSNHATKNGG